MITSFKQLYPPFLVIPMPLDKDGRGPAYENETVKMTWEIWDAVCQTVSIHDTEAEALNALVELRKNYG